ncbi:MAG: phenylacetate--CoA ligase family protein [Pirellula sp.]
MTELLSRSQLQCLDRPSLELYQLDRLNQLLAQVIPHNSYYQSKFGQSSLQLKSLSDWGNFPTSQKADWLGSETSGLAKHHTYPETSYRRYHRTSGTRGHPMVILDTLVDWQWWINTWQYVLDACSIVAEDRILMAFSFGPFIGFWSAHDACLHRGCMVIPSGGMSTAARIELIGAAHPTVIFSTPSYALHLASDAMNRGIDLSKSSIRKVFVAGEPGGSMPAIRSKIESMFGAEVMDHAGATEVGPWGFGSSDGQALHVIESEFIAEFLPIDVSLRNHSAAWFGELGPDCFELVLTSLGRVGAPVLRYRTGDIVRPIESTLPNCAFIRLEAGVLGRADDMIVVRGVNVFPSSIDSIVRSFPSISEYRLTVLKNNSLDMLLLEIESAESSETEDKIQNLLAEKLAIQLNLRFDVRLVDLGSLPRSEGKAKRIFDRR